MYWYLKNLHSETISRNNLYESTTKFRGISRNFAKLKSLSSLFRISRNKKILFRDHPSSSYTLLAVLVPEMSPSYPDNFPDPDYTGTNRQGQGAVSRAHMSGRQTTGLTRGSPPALVIYKGWASWDLGSVAALFISVSVLDTNINKSPKEPQKFGHFWALKIFYILVHFLTLLSHLETIKLCIHKKKNRLETFYKISLEPAFKLRN
jgi:hypothetical protein